MQEVGGWWLSYRMFSLPASLKNIMFHWGGEPLAPSLCVCLSLCPCLWLQTNILITQLQLRVYFFVVVVSISFVGLAKLKSGQSILSFNVHDDTILSLLGIVLSDYRNT